MKATHPLLLFTLMSIFLLNQRCSTDTSNDEMARSENTGESEEQQEETAVEANSIINTNDQGKLIDTFFFDLKGWPDRTNTVEKATSYLINDGMNGLRISIYGDIQRPAHPGPGVVLEPYYEPMLTSVLTALSVKPDIKIFASKKLRNTNSFPDWVKDGGGIVPKQYAIMLADFIQFMNNKGITIDYLGIDNEFVYNEGNITPQKYHETISELRILASTRGFDLPILVGYEDFGPNKRNWVQDLMDDGWGNDMDIYGTHYYPQFRPKDKLIADLNSIGDRPFWATEPHWDNVKEDKPDSFLNAEAAMVTLWDQTDLGTTGFMWWDYNLKDELRTKLMQAASTPLLGSRPITMTDIDGADIAELGKLQSRAFIKDKLVTVYFVNMTETSYTDYAIAFEDYLKIDGSVPYTQWRDNTTIDGESLSAEVIENNTMIQVNLPTRSISKIDITLE
ncbi:MAG: hypothetical protein AAFX53_07400 [Bacteroidota bacterium]